MEVSELVRELSHRLDIGHVEVLVGGADGARRGGMLAAHAHRVEHSPQGQIENDIMLMGTDNAKKIKTELC